MLFLNGDGEKILGSFEIIKIFAVISILFLVHWFMRNSSVKELSKKISPITLGLAWAIMLILIALAQGTGEQFIYFQF
jgi:alginate O-acetyltransferase complex protein AlgI